MKLRDKLKSDNELPILDYSYVVDDLQVLENTEKAKLGKPKNKLKYLWLMFMGKAYWDDRVSRRIAHSMTLIIHFSASFLIYLAFGRNNISILAAILFLFHPSNTEVSVWVSGKLYGIAALFALLAWWLPLFAPILYICPLMTINAIFSPLMFLLRRDWWNVLALLVIVTVAIKTRDIFNKEKNIKLQAYEHNEYSKVIKFVKIIIALKFYGYYIINNIFALKFCFYQSYMDDFADSQEGIAKGKRLDIYFWIGLSALCALSYLLVTQPYSILTLGLWWATINIAMWCNFINLGQMYISLRYGYIANIGLCLALASVLIHFPWIAGLWIGWYLRQLIYAVKQYENAYWHLFYQILNEPKFYYSWINIGNLNFARGNFSKAINDYMQALALRPGNFKALFNLSSGWFAKGDIKKCIYCFEQARKADLYGQEKKAQWAIKNRMDLIDRFVSARGNIKLRIEDIPVIA